MHGNCLYNLPFFIFLCLYSYSIKQEYYKLRGTGKVNGKDDSYLKDLDKNVLKNPSIKFRLLNVF